MAENRKLNSKRMKAAWEGLSEDVLSLDKAVTEIKSRSKAKFDETVEVVLNLGVDPRHSDQVVRGVVSMPNGTGKTIRVAVFAKGAAAEAAKKAGADKVGDDDLVEEIQKGTIDFDMCIATPDMMPVIGKVAKVLGPKGMMPNPKLGTVTPDPAEAVKKAKAGQVEFRAEKAGIVHAGIGKVSFDEKKLQENITAFFEAVKAAKPSGVKGTYIKYAHLTSSMGPSVKLDVQSIAA